MSALLPTALPTLDTHFPSMSCSLSCTRPGLHHSWLCLQSSRWRSGACCWAPSFPLISFHSLLGHPPSSLLRPTHPWNRLPYPEASAPLPPSPAPQGAPEATEAKGRRRGGWDQHQARNCPFCHLFPTQLKAGAIQKEHLVVARVWPLEFRDKVRNCHLLN